ncbi:integrase [Paenibacillus sp. FSL A5-0031]|uniref:tyrosine-type recombinase/integrase n=1 Tax=Paenibacillus sp. FSL A5-0031 TaxID=1920420 RepID=UPI00096CCB55|nr:tyrosine-type recombinase/integrase [Paenibacillus sp. FSL A5-0031]OME86942.1 integrase [Paenibacillus sp. FSL A5-0031]
MIRNNPKYTFASKRGRNVKFDFKTQIERYLQVKRVEKRSPKTIATYAQSLKQFREWFESRNDSELNSDTMREFIHYLTYEKVSWDDHPTSPNGKVGLSPRSVNNTIRNIKVFFNYLMKERVLTHSPLDAINYQKEEKETFELFTDEDVLKLLSAPNKRVYTGHRDYCMMLILIDGGLRVKELTSLKISDIDFKLRQVTVRAEVSKTKTTRVIPLSQRTVKEIEKLIEYMNVEENDYLWLTQFGERYFGDTFAKMLKLYAKRVGVTGARVSPHTFRHYMAVKFLRGGGDPIALARILGHTSLNMTQVYVRYTGTDLREQHDKASPVTSLLDQGNEKKRGRLRFN